MHVTARHGRKSEARFEYIPAIDTFSLFAPRTSRFQNNFSCPLLRASRPSGCSPAQHILTAVRAISPALAQFYIAARTVIPRPLPTTLPDHGEDRSCNQVGSNDKPANRGDSQKIVDHAMTEIKQADITDHDCENPCQAEADKP